MDRKLVYSLAKSRIPTVKQLKYLKTFLSKGELLLLRASLIILFLSLSFLTVRFYFTHRQLVPVLGGEYTEGVVGAPARINPLYLSINNADSDLGQLIFSSLFKRNENGGLEGDLAEKLEIGQDGKSYVIKIRSGVVWHGGGELSADDVIFTFNTIKDPDFKSPLRVGFSGVSAEKLDDRTVKFSLSESYAAFGELLTFGVMPEEFWSQVPANAVGLNELNLKPVGSGPYKFKSLIKDKNGNIKSYNLVANDRYYGEPPKIKDLRIKFFPSVEEAVAALNDGAIEGLGFLPREQMEKVTKKNSYNYFELNLPQLVAVFFNQKSNPALADKKVRQALAYGIDKQELVGQTLAGGARIIDGPIPPESFAFAAETKKYNYDAEAAAKLLDEAGWKIREISKEEIVKAEGDKDAKEQKTKEAALAILAAGEGRWRSKDGKFLAVKLTAAESGKNPEVAARIKDFWQKLNIKVAVEVLPTSQILTEMIKPRNFEALIYGELTGGDPDAYVFWHSSQSGAGGLNLANFSNKEADKSLEEGRLTTDPETRKKNYRKFQEVMAEELPAIFLYSPYYTYLQDKKIKNLKIRTIVLPSDRFAGINQQYINTDKRLVW